MDVSKLLDIEKYKKAKKVNSSFCWEVVFRYTDIINRYGLLWIDPDINDAIGCALGFTEDEIKNTH